MAFCQWETLLPGTSSQLTHSSLGLFKASRLHNALSYDQGYSSDPRNHEEPKDFSCELGVTFRGKANWISRLDELGVANPGNECRRAARPCVGQPSKL